MTGFIVFFGQINSILINSCTESTDRFDDLIGSLMPDEKSRTLVIDGEVIADGAFEFDRTAVRPALGLALAEQRGKQRDRAMVCIVMTASLGHTK
mgnify:CR=1 FL=1